MSMAATRRNYEPAQNANDEFGARSQLALQVVKRESAYAVVDPRGGVSTQTDGRGCYVVVETSQGTVSRQFENQTVASATPESTSVVKVRPFPVARQIPESYRIVQQWEGTVTEVGKDEFVARLRDLTDPRHADERAVFSLDEVDEDDLFLLRVGAVFYWSMGYHHQASGSRRLSNALRFRRIPEWTVEGLARLDEPSEIDDLFGSDD